MPAFQETEAAHAWQTQPPADEAAHALSAFLAQAPARAQQRSRQQQEVQEMEAQAQSLEKVLHACRAALATASQKEEAQLVMLIAVHKAAEAEKRAAAEVLHCKREAAKSTAKDDLA